MLWNMLTNKKFIMNEGPNKSSKSHEIATGLQQGTVNSPILFNIFISDLLQLFGLNNDNKRFAVAFADDILIYIRDNKPSIINVLLQDLFSKLQDYFHS